MKNLIAVMLVLVLFSCKDIRKEYYENGVLASEIEYKEELRNGKSIVYYPNGNIKQEGYFVDDKEHGLFKEYYETGRLATEAYFKNGKQDGELKGYHENGLLETIQYFKDGVPDSTFESYYSNGQLEMLASKEKGKTLWYVKYDSLGTLISESRPITITTNKDTIKLGEPIIIDFEVGGPIEDSILVSINVHYYDEPSKSSNPEMFYLKENKHSFSFVPDIPGKWGYLGNIWIGDLVTKQREFRIKLASFYVMENMDK